MFSLNEFQVEELNVVNKEDLIPYHLTGKRILHKQGYTGNGVKVAVVDTGCDWNHEALKDNIIEKTHNFCGYGGGSMDDHAHGTHCASTIVKIAPDSEIVPIKVMSPIGGENIWTINGTKYLSERDDIDVISMSLSSNMATGSSDYIAFHNVIKKCVEKNIFVVVASGNTGRETTLYPACFEEVTTVGAVDINKHEAYFSTLSNQVDICQIGVDLVGAKLGGGYVKMSGTSMATPMVAGMAALLIGKYKEQHGGKRPDGRLVHHMLKLCAIDMGIKGIDTKTGAGFISLDPSANVMKMQLYNNVYSVNGEQFSMDIRPFLKTPENRTLVPIRYANHGKEVFWNGENKTITIV